MIMLTIMIVIVMSFFFVILMIFVNFFFVIVMTFVVLNNIIIFNIMHNMLTFLNMIHMNI